MKSWKAIVANFAPTVAAALGGPLAGTATKFLASQLLGDENAKDAAIEAALLSATPADLAKLKEIDNNFALEMSKLDVDVFKLEIDDRQGARDLAKLNMWPQISLSALFIGGYFSLIFMLFSGEVVISENIKDMGNILLGVLTASVPQIMSFWFGSSSGSKEKTAKMVTK